MKNTDVDRGYSWIVLILCGIIYLVIAGGVKSFGVLYTEFLEYYEAGAGNTAWISSVCLLLFMGLGPFSNFLGEKYTYRLIMSIGSVLVLIGYTASAFVPRMDMLFLTYGVVAGTGYGLIFAPCTTIISFYFKKRRSLANGLMVSFSGFGSLLFPYMYRFLIDKYGLHGALLIIGAVFFHTCAAGLLLRQPPQLLKKKQKTEEELALATPQKIETPEKTQSGCFNEAKKRIFKLDLFYNAKYTILFCAILFQTANFSGNLVALPGHIQSLGLGKQTIALSVSLLGGSEIVARAFLGWFADLNIISRTHLFMVCSFVSTVIAFCIPHLPYKEAVLCYAVLMGVFSGSFWSLMGVLMVDCVGLDNFSPAFGLLSMASAFSIFISQPIIGWLKDATGSWNMSFRFTGLLSALSFLFCLTGPMIERCWCCHKQTGTIIIEDTIQVEEVNGKVEESILLKDR
ncbi:monocarboxylate transporter 14-like isoform X1 [Mytilus galloprovincialis]|uniref:monocarboxylate transporter 14-like isoform X1 n=1 Tax=Mytilus galloprovincialis TaxID=29158 RepID=UPI003F7B88EE